MRLLHRRQRVDAAPSRLTMGIPEDIWGPDLPALALWSSQVRRSWVFLHPPKTGGSTFAQTLTSHPDWMSVNLTALWRTDKPCTCGTGCRHAPRPTPLNVDDFTARPSLLISAGHVTYEPVNWIRDEIRSRGGRVDATVMTVRPIRNRLTSMFRDYWTQVRIAAEHAAKQVQLSAHRAVVVQQYADDSRHYLRDNNSIDGRAWFRAFAEHGTGGAPFFMSDFFSDPAQAREAIESGNLTLFPTASLDALLTDICGVAPPRRSRVSSPAHPEAVAAALSDAADLIEDLARRDDGYSWMTDSLPTAR